MMKIIIYMASHALLFYLFRTKESIKDGFLLAWFFCLWIGAYINFSIKETLGITMGMLGLLSMDYLFGLRIYLTAKQDSVLILVVAVIIFILPILINQGVKMVIQKFSLSHFLSQKSKID